MWSTRGCRDGCHGLGGCRRTSWPRRSDRPRPSAGARLRDASSRRSQAPGRRASRNARGARAALPPRCRQAQGSGFHDPRPGVRPDRRRRRLLLGRRRRARRGLAGRLHRLPRSRREEEQRIDIPMGLGRDADSEMQVRDGMLRFARHADRADGVALGDGRARAHGNVTEVDERDRVAVGGANRQRAPGAGNGAREGDDSLGRSAYGRPGGPADVDPAMRAAGVRIVGRREPLEHRTVGRPRPRARGSSRQSEPDQDEDCNRERSVACLDNHESTVARRVAVVKIGYSPAS